MALDENVVQTAEALYRAVYAAFFPSGIEDVVLDALTRLAIRYNLRVSSCQYDDRAVTRASCESTAVGPAKQPRTVTPKGVLLFRVYQVKEAQKASGEFTEMGVDTAAQLCSFLAAACTLRVVERLCIHLWTIPIAEYANDGVAAAMRAVITAEATRTQHCVLQLLSDVRNIWGCLLHQQSSHASSPAMPLAALLWGPLFFSPLIGADVAFRVSCERRVVDDKPGALKSVELAAAAGDTLWELHHPLGWEVSMLYYNVEFFLLQDNDNWLSCALTLSPPAPPRCGYDIDVTFQYAAELLRQHICIALRRGEVSLEQVKGLVPRVSTDRQEIRWGKGACAMRSAIASALCTYADIGNVASHSTCPVLMLDPFCGSGTTLLEAWVQLLQCSGSADSHNGGTGKGGGVLMGSELVGSDIRRTFLNTSSDYLSWIAACYGYAPPPEQRATQLWSSLEESVTTWRVSVEARVATAVQNGSYLTCGADGLRDLLCCGVEPPVDAHRKGGTYGDGGTTEWAVPSIGCSFAAVRCDATRVPARSGAVECIVPDMPFGRRCGSHKVNVGLYPLFLRECYRLLRAPSSPLTASASAATGASHRSDTMWWRRCAATDTCIPAFSLGGRAVLLTVEYRLMLDTLTALKAECPFHLVVPPFQVDMGGLFPFVFVLDKV
jgi:hypothetical protein